MGCQAVGEGEGVDKVVDVVALLVQKEGTVYDLEEAELCYGELWRHFVVEGGEDWLLGIRSV